MKLRHALILAELIGVPVYSASLDDVIKHVLASHPEIKSSEEDVKMASSSVLEHRFDLLPAVNLQGADNRKHSKVTTTTGTTGTETTSKDRYIRLNSSLNLFNGFGDYFVDRGRQAEKEAADLQRLVKKEAVAVGLGQIFFDVLSKEKDLLNLQNLAQGTRDQINELTARVKIGRARVADLLLAKARYASVNAELESMQQEIRRAREEFHAVTGMPSETNLVWSKTRSFQIPLQELIDSITKRPDWALSELEKEIAGFNLKTKRSDFLPKVDLSGNYYLQRTGASKNDKWDMQLQATLPLTGSLGNYARVKEASADERKAEYAQEKLKLDLQNRSMQLWTSYQSLTKQYQALEEAQKLYEENYKAQRKDFQYGLTNAADVLTYLADLQENMRKKDQTFYKLQATEFEIQLFRGAIPL